MHRVLVAIGALAIIAVVGCHEECTPRSGCNRICSPGLVAYCVAPLVCDCVPPSALPDGGGSVDAGAALCPPPQPGDLIINEAMIDGLGTDGPTEFVELVHAGATDVSMRGVVLVSNKGDDLATRVEFLSGCLPPKTAIAMFADIESWVWHPAPAAVTAETKSFGFVNNGDFVFVLKDANGAELSVFAGPAEFIEEDHSANRSPDLSGTVVVRHLDASENGWRSSPARCANGGTFAAGCLDPIAPGAGIGDPDAGVPRPPECLDPAPGEIVINEILVDAVDEPQGEFVELVSRAHAPIWLGGIALEYANAAGEFSPIVTFSDGCIGPGGAVAAFSDPALWQWVPVLQPVPLATVGRFALANSRDFALRLMAPSGAVIDEIVGATALVAEGISANRSLELGGELVRHTDVPEAGGRANSPARCANGGTFESGCTDAP